MTNCVGDQETRVQLKTKSYFINDELNEEERCFSSCHELGTKKKFWVPMRNWTSDLRILHCDALPLSQNQSQSNLKTFRIWKSKVWLLWYNHGYLICALMLCHWAGIGVWHCRSEVQFLMGTQNFFFVQRLWQDEKHLSLFLHWAQNLPSLLFFLQAEWYLPFDWFFLMIYWKQMHRWSHNREIFFSLSYNTNRFHVAMDLFSSRSQKTITCNYNISNIFSCTLCATFLFLLYFDLNCDLYLNRFMVPWNLFVNYNREFGCLTPDWLVFLQIILGFCKCHGHWLKSCGKKEKMQHPKFLVYLYILPWKGNTN